MHTRLLAGLTMGLTLWTGAALAQGKPPCDQQGKAKTPERVAGEVTSIDKARGTVTVREADGTMTSSKPRRTRSGTSQWAAA
jgi:hypothetical protein